MLDLTNVLEDTLEWFVAIRKIWIDDRWVFTNPNLHLYFKIITQVQHMVPRIESRFSLMWVWWSAHETTKVGLYRPPRYS